MYLAILSIIVAITIVLLIWAFYLVRLILLFRLLVDESGLLRLVGIGKRVRDF